MILCPLLMKRTCISPLLMNTSLKRLSIAKVSRKFRTRVADKRLNGKVIIKFEISISEHLLRYNIWMNHVGVMFCFLCDEQTLNGMSIIRLPNPPSHHERIESPHAHCRNWSHPHRSAIDLDRGAHCSHPNPQWLERIDSVFPPRADWSLVPPIPSLSHDSKSLRIN